MLIPFVVGLIAVILTYLSQNRQNGLGLKLSFVLLFVFLALRYDYGNDYMHYLTAFKFVTSYEQISLTAWKWEPGWVLLQSIFKPFGFFVMVWFTSLATCVLFYRFIRNYVPAQYQWLAVFLYVFDPYLILVPGSAMRQNLTIILFLLAIDFLYRRKIIIYLLVVGIGITFHKSGFVLLPLVVLPFINIKINKMIASGFFLFFISMYAFGHHILPYLSRFIGAHFEKYAEYYYTGGGTITTGLGSAYMIFQLIVILYYSGIELDPHSASLEEELPDSMDNWMPEPEFVGLPADHGAVFPALAARRLLFKLALIMFIVLPLSRQINMFTRIMMYFSPVMIVVFPIIAFTARDRFFKLIFMSSLMAFTLLKFWLFFLAPVWRYKFGTYQTIFSAPHWY